MLRNAVGGGGGGGWGTSDFPEKNQCEYVRFNIIRDTRGWVGGWVFVAFPETMRYVTIEWSHFTQYQICI